MIAVADVQRLPLADDSADLLFGSPPYEAARTYGIGFALTGREWVTWALAGFLECLRVCRGLVAWVVSGQTRNYAYSAAPERLMVALQDRGVILRRPLIYYRIGIPGSGGPDWLRADHESIICAAKHQGRLPWSDVTAMGHRPKWAPGGAMSHRLSTGERRNQWGGTASRATGHRKKDGNRERSIPPSHDVLTKRQLRADRIIKPAGERGKSGERQAYIAPVKANPGSVIRCKAGGGLMGDRLCHENEAPFSERLAEFFIRSWCPPGGIVLDPFSGSGTTAKIAALTGRRFIALDIRPSQCLLTRRRLGLLAEI